MEGSLPAPNVYSLLTAKQTLRGQQGTGDPTLAPCWGQRQGGALSSDGHEPARSQGVYRQELDDSNPRICHRVEQKGPVAPGHPGWPMIPCKGRPTGGPAVPRGQIWMEREGPEAAWSRFCAVWWRRNRLTSFRNPNQTELMVGGGRDKANNSINNNNRPMGVGREDRQPVLKFQYSLRTDVTATLLSTWHDFLHFFCLAPLEVLSSALLQIRNLNSEFK